MTKKNLEKENYGKIKILVILRENEHLKNQNTRLNVGFLSLNFVPLV